MNGRMGRAIVAALVGCSIGGAIACGDDDEGEEVAVSADPEAEERPTPTPEEPEEESADPQPDDEDEDGNEAEPAPAPVTDVITEPTDAPLPEKMDRRIRNWLRQQKHVRSQIASVRSLPRESGGRRVLALLTYSAYEACMAEHPEDPAEGRSACRRHRSSDDDEGDSEQMFLHLVVASFGPTPRRSPVGWGGQLEVTSDVVLDEHCAGGDDAKLDERDLDGDGEPEVEVIYGCDESYVDDRSEGLVSAQAGQIRIVRPADGSVQLSARLWELEEFGATAPQGNTARRISFHDEDGDGTAELILESTYYDDGTGCTEPDEFGFIGRRPEDTDPDSPCEAEIRREVFPYDRAADRWNVTAEDLR